MTALVKIKNPVEYRFQQWIGHYPESAHPFDRRRFLLFVKNICTFNARRWKDADYLEKRILKSKPHFDRDRLQQKLIIFESLIDFFDTPSDKANWEFDPSEEVSKDCYVELGFREKKFYRTEKPLRRSPETKT